MVRIDLNITSKELMDLFMDFEWFSIPPVVSETKRDFVFTGLQRSSTDFNKLTYILDLLPSKVIADHLPGRKLISAVSSKKEPKSSILYKSS